MLANPTAHMVTGRIAVLEMHAQKIGDTTLQFDSVDIDTDEAIK